VISLLDRAIAGCKAGEFAPLTTAPVHKGVINDAGIPFIGHTSISPSVLAPLRWS